MLGIDRNTWFSRANYCGSSVLKVGFIIYIRQLYIFFFSNVAFSLVSNPVLIVLLVSVVSIPVRVCRSSFVSFLNRHESFQSLVNIGLGTLKVFSEILSNDLSDSGGLRAVSL